ncbi:hypothetical protein KGA66_22570 [Actinocrinis puniceicyclus]|uniref:YD repeat-containing protein n=1 Tax=Actinocrinis puniceicyclus TaxID=977794 RepID=A0A8J7WQW9_9ACTN|nr:hypothetical protein [Actinocrinis puniceicyclus]MBS2965853.1 hypothetical protein [Actinocrinis puniceicyclus]
MEVDAAGRITAVNAATWTETYAYGASGNLVDAADSRTLHLAAQSGPDELRI